MTDAGTQAKAAAGVTFDELLRHNEEEAERWHERLKPELIGAGERHG